MKKLIFILFTLISIGLFTQVAVAKAQSPSCSNSTTGCFVCEYPDPNTPGLPCLFNNNVACKPGYQPGPTDLNAYCSNLACNQSVAIPCVPIAAPQTSYYCVTATKTCNSCTTGNCPANVQLYNSDTGGLGACTTVCRDTTPQACTGFCKTSCQTGETIDNGGSCQTQGQMCCKPAVGNPAGCAAQGGSCKTSCSAGESGGTSSFCAAPTGMCCYPDAQASNKVDVNLQGTCANANEIDTAIGCIPIGDVNTFAAFFLKWGLGIAGGIGMIFLVYASFMIITSQGDPKRLQVGKELLMSAISGIIMLALSLFIFRILGVNILGLF